VDTPRPKTSVDEVHTDRFGFDQHFAPMRGGPRLVDVLQDFGSTDCDDFDSVRGDDSNLTLNTLSLKRRKTADAWRCRPSHRRHRTGPRESWQRACHGAMATLRHTKALAGRWPTRKPSTTLPTRCTPPVKTPSRLVRRPLATDAYAAPPPRATRVRARRRLCNRQPADL
jgi:hypothetical protein